MTKIRVLLVIGLAGALTAACMQTSTPSDGAGSTTPPTGNQGVGTGTKESDWAAILKLEEQAKAIAKTTGCASSSECRSAPVGSRSCGGPRYYIPWCAKSTDSAALYAKLNEVARAEQAYNKKYDLMSTCEYRLAPKVEVVAGACTAR
ncbi:MAG TPA: hypothetical protein VM053_12330 [Gemmatimonadaceae bacterium]|nr:hypothetical protein [Gemmatimonadaceae bacterium]